MSEPQGLWLSVDGVEGAGKTTFAQSLQGALASPLTVAGFGDSLVGDYLRKGVQKDPHFFANSRLGQSLTILGDFFDRHVDVTARAVGDGEVVIQDRGFLCKYVYQYVVLKDEFGERAAKELLGGIFNAAASPDVTVLLTAPNEVIHRRLIGRGEAVDAKRARFIDEAQKMFESPPVDAGQLLTFDTSSLEPGEIVSEVLAAIPELVS